MTLVIAYIEDRKDDMWHIQTAYCSADSLVSNGSKRLYTKRKKIVLHSVKYKIASYSLGHLNGFRDYNCYNICTAFAGSDLISGNVSLHFADLLDNLYEVVRTGGQKEVVYKNDYDVPYLGQRGVEEIMTDNTPRLSVDKLAEFFRGIVEELTYDRIIQNLGDFSELASVSCEALLLGKCMVSKRFRLFKIFPRIETSASGQTVVIHKEEIQPNTFVLLGSHAKHTELFMEIDELRNTGVAFDLIADQILQNAIASKDLVAVGGEMVKAQAGLRSDDFIVSG